MQRVIRSPPCTSRRVTGRVVPVNYAAMCSCDFMRSCLAHGHGQGAIFTLLCLSVSEPTKSVCMYAVVILLKSVCRHKTAQCYKVHDAMGFRCGHTRVLKQDANIFIRLSMEG